MLKNRTILETIILMFNSSPAWSFPTKNANKTTSKAPSPSTYSPETWKTKTAPSWKIGSEKRYKFNTQHYPGPGEYDTNYSTKTKVLGKFGIQKYKTFQTDKNPDPAQYVPNYKFNRKSSPSHSFCLDSKTPKKLNVPGPGAYLANQSNLMKGIKIAQQKRFQDDIFIRPGPTSYNPSEKCIKKRPSSAKIGKQKRNMNRKSKSPGPADYTIGESKHHKIPPKYSFSRQKRQKLAEAKTPGPGDYNMRSPFGSIPAYALR